MNKKELRQYIKEIRSSVNQEQKNYLDNLIYEKTINSDFYKSSKFIFIYVSFGNEVDTHRIINYSLANNKIICVPKIINKKEGMKAVIIQSINELQLSSFGILEPEDFQNSVDPKEIDLLFIPGLAFDNKGGRIGYGAGYYDRYLKTVREDAYKVGLAYDFQIIPSVPMETYDTFIDDIIVS